MTTEETRAFNWRGHSTEQWAHRTGIGAWGQTGFQDLAMAAGRLDAGGVWDLEDADAHAAAQLLLGHRAVEPAANT